MTSVIHPSTSQEPTFIFHMSSFQTNASSYKSIPLIACVLKSPARCTASDCVSPHTCTRCHHNECTSREHFEKGVSDKQQYFKMLQKCAPLAKGPYCRGQDNNCKLCQECVEMWVSCKVSVITRQHTACKCTGSLKNIWNTNLASQTLCCTEKKKLTLACYWTISEILVLWKSKNVLVLARYTYENVWWRVMTHRQDKTRWPTNYLSWNCTLTVNSWSWRLEAACGYGALINLFRKSQKPNSCKTDSNCAPCKVTQDWILSNKQQVGCH